MDPKFDPTVKVIPDKKEAKASKKSKEAKSRSMRKLTSREEAKTIISSKKA